MELRRPTVSTAHLSCTVDVQELQVPGIKAEDVHLVAFWRELASGNLT